MVDDGTHGGDWRMHILWIHGLQFWYSKGRLLHHGIVIDVVKHWRQQNFCIYHLQFVHIYKSHSKHPARWGIYHPLEGWWLWWGWWKGVLVWDITCSDALAPSYIQHLQRERCAGTVMAEMECRKRVKHAYLDTS